MDTNLASQSPETSDLRPSFRKPVNDASHRKYRRHSPVSGSSSPSSSGGHKHDRSASPNISQGDITKATNIARKERTCGERDSGRYHDHSHGRRGGDSTRDYDRDRSYGRTRNYHGRPDEYSNSRRNGGSDDREYHRYSSRSGQDYKIGARSEFSKRDDDYDRSSRDDRWSGDRSSRDKGFYEGSRKRKEMEKDRDKNNTRDRYKNLDRDVYLERFKTGSRHNNDSEMKEESRDRDGLMDGSRDSDKSRDRERNRDDNRDKSGDKDLDTYKDDKLQHKKRDDVRERDRNKEKHFKELDRYSKPESKFSSFYKGKDEKERDRYRDEDEGNARREQKNEQRSDKDSRSSRDGKHQAELSDGHDAGRIQGKGTLSIDERKSAKSTTDATESSSSMAAEAEVTHDLNVAKLAAMKAAELVNKNLGVSGCMSADQKKKLLWGNKKTTAIEESANKNPWEKARFDDPDRQEKFNKLMGVKGESKMEKEIEDKDGGLFAAEKQKELQQDLEKQFTAGLRRRDGRTVGLGL